MTSIAMATNCQSATAHTDLGDHITVFTAKMFPYLAMKDPRILVITLIVVVMVVVALEVF